MRQMLPHTHLRGKELGVHRRPTRMAATKKILSVPALRLQLADRLRLQGAAEAAEGDADPRRRALRQLDRATAPTRTRRPTSPWGDQTWEEMMFTSFVYSLDGVAPGADDHRAPGGQQYVTVTRRSLAPVPALRGRRGPAAAAAARRAGRARSDHHQGHVRPRDPRHSRRALRDVPLAAAGRADAADDLRRGPPVGARDQGAGPDAADAEVARRARLRRVHRTIRR